MLSESVWQLHVIRRDYLLRLKPSHQTILLRLEDHVKTELHDSLRVFSLAFNLMLKLFSQLNIFFTCVHMCISMYAYLHIWQVYTCIQIMHVHTFTHTHLLLTDILLVPSFLQLLGILARFITSTLSLEDSPWQLKCFPFHTAGSCQKISIPGSNLVYKHPPSFPFTGSPQGTRPVLLLRDFPSGMKLQGSWEVLSLK